MGSSPSYEGQTLIQNHRHQSKHSSHIHKTSRRVSDHHNQEEAEINPQRKDSSRVVQGHTEQVDRPFQQFSPEEPQVKLSNKQSNGIHATPQIDYQAIANSHIPKKVASKQVEEDIQDQEINEEENQQVKKPAGRQRYHYPIKGREHQANNNSLDEYEETPRAIDHQKRRNYVKDTTNSRADMNTNKPHRRADEIDYHQYDSAHIRHKAIQEIHQQEHPTHPNKHSREPIYEHEKLYPKILKNFHKDKEGLIDQQHLKQSNNRHYQHEFDVDEEYYQQPHKPHLYKRLRIPMTERTHEEPHEEEQPARKDYHNLQRSQEMRQPHKQQIHEIKKSMNVRPKVTTNDHPQEPKETKRRGSIEQEQAAVVPNFRKKKVEENIEEGKKQLQQFQSKSIAEMNRQNQFNVTEFNIDPLELVTCRQGCGRKFHADRIKKHEQICRNIFQGKRKEFNAQEQRIVSKQQKKLLKKGPTKAQVHKGSIPKWKAQSIALRAHIKMGMDENYTPNQQEMEMLSQEHHIDVVNCTYCGRNFNKNAAKSHIPFCKGKYEKEMEKERFQKPSKARR